MSIVKPPVSYVWKLTSNAEEVWRGLNGVVAIYKPPGNTTPQIRNTLTLHLCRDFNEMNVRPPVPHVVIEGATNERMSVRVQPSYADHELVVGPRYQESDFRIRPSHLLTKNMSGVMLFGINNGTRMAEKIKATNPMRFYKVKGLLGQATDDYFITGKIVEKSTFNFIKRHHVDAVCAAVQTSHQKKMFELCGVNIQSQAAYDLAVQGPLRPADNNIPMMYSLKCIDFDPPEFTLELVCLNENEMFLKSLVHGIGLQLRSTATCTQMQCIQYGIFTVDITLLKRDWDLQSIIQNMNKVRFLLSRNKFLFEQNDPIYRKYINNVST